MDIRLGAACAVLLLAACAGTPPAGERQASAVSQAAGADLVCDDQSTGTHVRRQETCRTREDMERERAAATRAMERMGRVPGTVSGN